MKSFILSFIFPAFVFAEAQTKICTAEFDESSGSVTMEFDEASGKVLKIVDSGLIVQPFSFESCAGDCRQSVERLKKKYGEQEVSPFLSRRGYQIPAVIDTPIEVQGLSEVEFTVRQSIRYGNPLDRDAEKSSEIDSRLRVVQIMDHPYVKGALLLKVVIERSQPGIWGETEDYYLKCI